MATDRTVIELKGLEKMYEEAIKESDWQLCHDVVNRMAKLLEVLETRDKGNLSAAIL
jgi:hypothetical protein